MTTEYIIFLIFATFFLVFGIWSVIRLSRSKHTSTSQLPPYTPPAPEPQPEDKGVHVVGDTAFKLQHYRNGKGQDVWTIGERGKYDTYYSDLNAEDYDSYDLPDYGGFEFQIIDDDDKTVAFPNKADAESLLDVIIDKEERETWHIIDD